MTIIRQTQDSGPACAKIKDVPGNFTSGEPFLHARDGP